MVKNKFLPEKIKNKFFFPFACEGYGRSEAEANSNAIKNFVEGMMEMELNINLLKLSLKKCKSPHISLNPIERLTNYTYNLISERGERHHTKQGQLELKKCYICAGTKPGSVQ